MKQLQNTVMKQFKETQGVKDTVRPVKQRDTRSLENIAFVHG